MQGLGLALRSQAAGLPVPALLQMIGCGAKLISKTGILTTYVTGML